MEYYKEEAPPIAVALEHNLSQLVRIAHRYEKHGEHAKAAEVLETVRKLREKLNLPDHSSVVSGSAQLESNKLEL